MKSFPGPRALQDVVLQMLARNATGVMTNVPGPQQPLYLAGAAIDSLMFWVPQSGDIGMGVSILSYAGAVQFGVITDAGLAQLSGLKNLKRLYVFESKVTEAKGKEFEKTIPGLKVDTGWKLPPATPPPPPPDAFPDPVLVQLTSSAEAAFAVGAYDRAARFYGLALARESAATKREIIVAEGYMDVIALHQAGLPGAVAALGTASNVEHLNRLFRQTDSLTLAFDGDEAGQRASRS